MDFFVKYYWRKKYTKKPFIVVLVFVQTYRDVFFEVRFLVNSKVFFSALIFCKSQAQYCHILK